MRRYMKGPTKQGLEMFKQVSLLLLVVIMVFSCKSRQVGTSEVDSYMELIVQDNYSGAEEEELLIVRDKKGLSSFFAKINRTRKPGIPIPKVDFTKNVLVIWCTGESYRGTPELSIKNETDRQYTLRKSKTKKEKLYFAITSPFSIYKLPLNHKRIVFE